LSAQGGRSRPPISAGLPQDLPPTIPRRVAITGTDTGVGKTAVGSLLARAWNRAGLRVTVAKPVESGVPARPNRGSDAERLARAAGDDRALPRISPYRLHAAIAPTAAAEAEGVMLDPQLIRSCIRDALAVGDATIVEGAGGLLVPLAPGLTLRGLAAEFDLPLLVVVADRLGCVNHALLTLEAARAAACRVCGLVLCRTSAAPDDSHGTNRMLLERHARVPVLFEVPHLAAADLREGLDDLVRKLRLPI
jgi:dethiobiotin synthetase